MDTIEASVIDTRELTQLNEKRQTNFFVFVYIGYLDVSSKLFRPIHSRAK